MSRPSSASGLDVLRRKPVRSTHQVNADRVIVAFVHGGVHTGACWDDTITAVGRMAPSITCFAVDMPGRRGVPGDLASLTISQCVRSVADQVTAKVGGNKDTYVVLVGHSLAGVVIPGVAELLRDFVKHVIFVACCVPPQGKSVVDTLRFPLNHITRWVIRRSAVISRPPPGLVRFFFANGATRAQRAAVRASLCPESSALLVEDPKASLPPSVRTSWLLPTRDRALRPASQRSFIGTLGGVDHLVAFRAGHEVMLTHPEQVAIHVVRLVRSVLAQAD